MPKTYETRLIGAKLRHFFEQEGVTQQQLAQKLDTRQSWISRIFEGDFTLRSKVAIELCQMAGITLETGHNSSKTNSQTDIRLFRIAQQLQSLAEQDKTTLKKLSQLLKTLEVTR